MIPENLRPLKNRVLVEAFAPNESNGIILPEETIEFGRYPPTGFVRATPKKSELKIGDFIVIEDEGFHEDPQYFDAFEIYVSGEEDPTTPTRIVADADAEPTFREQVHTHRANPSTYDVEIVVRDLESGDGFRFLTSDVLDFGFCDLALPRADAEYIPAVQLYLRRGPRTPLSLHYLIPEDKIIAVIDYE